MRFTLQELLLQFCSICNHKKITQRNVFLYKLQKIQETVLKRKGLLSENIFNTPENNIIGNSFKKTNKAEVYKLPKFSPFNQGNLNLSWASYVSRGQLVTEHKQT